MDHRLRRHLAQWLGQWPATAALSVVGSVRRERPGWDGAVHPLIGIATGRRTVLSVPTGAAARVRELAARIDDLDALLRRVPAEIGRPGARVYRAVFRWTRQPAPLPEAGVWVAADDPVVPDWLRVFGGQVLVATDPDSGRYLAGVGLKRHDRYGREIAVGTEPAARGRGLARRLVAQASRRVLDEGALPTYLHAPDNLASARVAAAAGFSDTGWTCLAAG